MKTVVDFPDQGVLKEEAAEWLIRLDGDSPPTQQELETLGQWLHRSPAHREELERLATLWDRMNVLTELAVPLGKRRSEIPPTRLEGATSLVRARGLRPAIVGALIIGAFALGLAWHLRGVFDDRAAAADGLYATAVGQQTTIELPDGSQIILNTNSQIRVDYGDQYRRVHLLQGEALFTVATDSDRPFRVYAGSGRIQAVGTAFSVYLKGLDVQVTVTEGRVALASLDLPLSKVSQPVTLAAGQRAGRAPNVTTDDDPVESLGTLAAGQVATIRGPENEAGVDNAPTPKVIESPLPPNEIAKRLAWRDGILMFSGDRLEDVVKEVSRYTTVAIEIPEPDIRNMRIGGRFPVGETEVMLGALESNFNLRVTYLSHDRVIVTAADE
jgi:transmembrane sensor